MIENGKRPQVARRQPLVNNLLVLEGISRTGKFLLADIVNGFNAVEPVQSKAGSIDHIPFFERFGLIERETAKELLRCEIDVYCYEMLIGRNLNFRLSDKSSIFRVPNHQEIVQRCENEDDVLLNFYDHNVYSSFIAHELMPNIELHFETFPEMKVISNQRNPVDTVASLFKRGYAERINNDPKFFTIYMQGESGPRPWYTLDWEEDFYALNPMDRMIKSIETLMEINRESYIQLPPEQKKQILFVRYEDVLSEPENVIVKIGRFLNRQPLQEMELIIKREKLPNQEKLDLTTENRKEIKELSSAEYYQRLLKLEAEFNNEKILI